MLAAVAATNRCHISFLSRNNFPLSVKNSSCKIYGFGGGLLAASVNAPWTLLEIYCCIQFVCGVRMQLTRDLLAIANFVVDFARVFTILKISKIRILILCYY